MLDQNYYINYSYSTSSFTEIKQLFCLSGTIVFNKTSIRFHQIFKRFLNENYIKKMYCVIIAN